MAERFEKFAPPKTPPCGGCTKPNTDPSYVRGWCKKCWPWPKAEEKK